MNKLSLRILRGLFSVFLVVAGLSLLLKDRLAEKGVDWLVLFCGNFLVFAVTLAAFGLTNRALRSEKPQAFVRAMYGGFLIKFFVLALAAFVYIMVAKKGVNKTALGACAVLYILYTAIEIRGLMQMLKEQKHA